MEGNGSPKKMPVITDPYRPPVGLTPTDDIPIVVQRSEKLPSEHAHDQSREITFMVDNIYAQSTYMYRPSKVAATLTRIAVKGRAQ